MFRTCRVILVALCLTGTSAASAAVQHEHPVTMPREGVIGHAHFPVSCRGEQQAFDQATTLLHSFWYEKAEAAFAGIAERDPDCAMARWGQALSLWHPLWPDRPDGEVLARGRALLAQAHGAKQRTQQEAVWLGALAAFYAAGGSADYRQRVLAYERAMARVHAGSPREPEAAAFYALALLASAQVEPPDQSHARERKAADLLNHVLAVEPDHPGALHYLIHAYDSPPLAKYALGAARRYALIAPAVPHAQHMPSHIFTRLGLWDESVASNRGAESAAKRFAAEMRLPGAWDEQLHAMDYLEYAYLQLARDRDARTVQEELLAIPVTSPANFKVAYAYAAIPARYAIERRQWREAAALNLHHRDFPWTRFPPAQAITEFARALGAARSGDQARAAQALGRLQSLEGALRESGDAYWGTQVEIQRLAAQAWLAHAQGRQGEALVAMRQAADLEGASEKRPVTPGPIVPARELLGDLLLELDRPAEALDAYRVALTESPNRFNSLAGALCAARRSGERNIAHRYAGQLPRATADSQSRRPEFELAHDTATRTCGR
jgi:tetratricopeptide (TPR) repeat protein